MKGRMRTKKDAGQALLIIILILAVGLTIGLSVVSRSITDVRISQEQEESARAFSVAEAGLESLLVGGSLPSFEGFEVTSSTKKLGDWDSIRFPEKVKAGDTQTLWLVDHLDEDTLGTNFYQGSTINLYWGSEGQIPDANETPALEAILYYDDNGFKTRRWALDPNSSRVSKNKFEIAEFGYSTVDREILSFMKIIDLPAGNKYALRLKLIYNLEPQWIGVASGGFYFPLQGNCYQVTAQTVTSNITRKVEQCQLFKSLPDIFDYVLFSESNL